MNASINFSTFLHSDNKSSQNIKPENTLPTDINNIDEVNPEKNTTNNISSEQTRIKP